MELFRKNSQRLLTVNYFLEKHVTLGIWQGPKYTYGNTGFHLVCLFPYFLYFISEAVYPFST